MSGPTTSTSCECKICGQPFPSKTQLFKHIEQHGYINPNAKPCKCGVLVGWLSNDFSDAHGDVWVRDLSQGTSEDNFREILSVTNPRRAQMETTLFAAIYAMQNNISLAEAAALPFDTIRPKSLTRASCHSRANDPEGLESSTHGVADLFCILLAQAPGEEQAWINKINLLLPEDIRVLQCKVLPANGNDFHANSCCSQLRYEVILPLTALIPADCIRSPMQTERMNEVLEGLQQYFSINCDGEHLVTRVRQAWQGEMDQEFPSHTEEGKLRVRFFRILKKIMRRFGGKFIKFHNFVSGGCVPDDASSERRVDRLYHKELIESEGETFVVMSISGDSFLRGQIRRMLATTLAVIKGFIPIHLLDAVFSKDIIINLPTLPGYHVCLTECKFANYEGKHDDIRLDPRRAVMTESEGNMINAEAQMLQVKPRIKNNFMSGITLSSGGIDCPTDTRQSAPPLGIDIDISADAKNNPNLVRLLQWKKRVQDHVIGMIREADAKAKQEGAPHWLETLERVSVTAAAQLGVQVALLENIDRLEDQRRVLYGANAQIGNVSATEVDDEEAGEEGDESTPPVYRRVLRLLRAADRSGLWPNSSTARERVLLSGTPSLSKSDAKAVKAATAAAAAAAKEAALETSGDATQSADKEKQPGTKEGKPKGPRTAHNGGKKKSKPGKYSSQGSSTAPTPMTDTGDATANEDKDKEVAKSATGSGSFSVGVLPPPMLQPKGNALFPDLLFACFQLERALFPDRMPSSMVAINRHAQFKPHRDSGAGNGQSVSLIVSLGRFTGGELGVEGQVHDIRYKPLEFDGWSQRHWTLPFAGERYSLVWFTPLGVEQEDLFWWREGDITQQEKEKRQRV